MKYGRSLLIGLIFLLIPLSTSLANSNSDSGPQLFPQLRLFDTKLADPHEVQLSARIMFNRNEFGGNIGYSIGVMQFYVKNLPLQFQIEGNTFLVTKVKKPDFPMQSSDFTIAFPIDVRYKNFSGRIKWKHTSSHLGDDFNRIEDVYDSIDSLGNNYTYFSRPKKFSREFLEIFGSIDKQNNRLYWGFTWAYHITMNKTDFEPYDPLVLQFGYEVFDKNKKKLVKPFLAMDTKLRQHFKWQPDINLQVGMIIGNNQLGRMRLALEFYNGYSNQGQFFNRKDKDLNFVLAFDL